MEILRRNIRDLDISIWVILLLLAVYGCVAIAVTTHNNPDPNIPTHIMTKQIIWECAGIAIMLAATVFDYRTLRPIRWWIYGAAMLFLVGVFGFPAVQGAHSWISLKVVSFQPSEFAKVALIVSLAGFMADVDESENPDYRLRKMWPIAVMFVPMFALTYKEPALGQALVMIAIVITMYTVFARRSHFAWIVAALAVGVTGISVAAVMFSNQTTQFINDVIVKHHLLKAYQVNRIIVWLNPNYSLNHYGYNIHMAQVAIGSGQLFGEGLFHGHLTGNGWVPNQWTDYIFTAIGEEFGFIGSAVLVFLFLVLIYRMIEIARTSTDSFGAYLVIGTVGMMAFQVFENIGMDMYLSPSTGITLPFISYGGTSLVIDYLAMGIILSVGLRRRTFRFK
ncbi:rod shape-determining protein RodA [Alicyclobacillus tolerans]|uniref:FtsW/RodA/SpoVE family cell cycle protein n=1 Tax=Alicyclobacillus tolerans TaxID=90970 RepID=UPI001F2E7DF6|nr:FtsW/RodA/SpoVE family cell cycle protein [Alicyclobacillus tolerans]MCF8567137.1 rod shape-determining protein RodA [Alicyclobacillus tolerans]